MKNIIVLIAIVSLGVFVISSELFAVVGAHKLHKVEDPNVRPKAAVAITIKVINEVMRQKENQTNWEGISRGQPLISGDNLKTGNRSVCVLKLIDGSIARIQEKTQIRINVRQAKNKKKLPDKSLYVKNGKVVFDVKNKPGEEFRFVSPTAVASIKGTVGSYKCSDEETVLVILEGRAELDAINGNTVVVKAGQMGISTKRLAKVRDMTKQEIDLERLLIQIDDRKKKGERGDKKKEDVYNIEKEDLEEKPDRIILKIRDKDGVIKTRSIRPLR